MVFKKKKPEEKVQEVPEVVVPEVESPEAEELSPEAEELLKSIDDVEKVQEVQEEIEGQLVTPESLDDELNSELNKAFLVINQRLLRLEAEGFRRLN